MKRAHVSVTEPTTDLLTAKRQVYALTQGTEVMTGINQLPTLFFSLLQLNPCTINLTWNVPLSKPTSLFTTARVVLQDFFHSTRLSYPQRFTLTQAATCQASLCIC